MVALALSGRSAGSRPLRKRAGRPWDDGAVSEGRSHRELSDLLFEHWDALDLASHAPYDEYDSEAIEVLDILMRGGAYDDVYAALQALVAANGSSADRDDARDERVARMICEWFSRGRGPATA